MGLTTAFSALLDAFGTTAAVDAGAVAAVSGAGAALTAAGGDALAIGGADAAGLAGASGSLLGQTVAEAGLPGSAGAGYTVAAGGGSQALTGAAGGSLADAASYANLAKGGVGLLQAAGMGGSTSAAASRADPFGPYREQYAQQLQALTADPAGQLSKTPGYQAGLDAVQRSQAAQGFQGSGNMATALQKYGGDIYNQQVTQLSGLAGATVNPGTAGTIMQQGATNQTNLIGQSLGTLAQGGLAGAGTAQGSIFGNLAAGMSLTGGG